ncbi:MAG: hypothetical protein EA383_01745 [Spirochaetaceae bacterium]|nr:MAG: hypothetical protein EA383_01745 [Spirochaetaceae bacterium]
MDAEVVLPGVERTDIAGIPVDIFTEEAIPEAVDAMLASDTYHQIVFLRTWDLMRARRSPQFRQCVRESSLSVPVSRGIKRSAGFLRRRPLSRHMPFEFVIRMLSALEQRNRSVYILGGDKTHLHRVEEGIKLTFPGIRVVGRYTGYYPKEYELNITTAIKKSAPDLLLVGPGISGKDLWVFTHRKLFNPGICVWSTEVFDIFSDRKRKPTRQAFLRGTDRISVLLTHPWRMLRLPVYLWFGLVLLYHRIRKR